MQTWNERYGRVENETVLGRDLQAFAKRQLKLIVNSKWECGWSDGGCRIFAEALEEWGAGKISIKAVLHRGTSGEWSADHVVGSYVSLTGREFLLDAEGVADESSLLSRWAEMEGREGCRLGAFDAKKEEFPDGPPSSPELSRKVAVRLKRKFGEFSDLLLHDANSVFDRSNPKKKGFVSC